MFFLILMCINTVYHALKWTYRIQPPYSATSTLELGVVSTKIVSQAPNSSGTSGVNGVQKSCLTHPSWFTQDLPVSWSTPVWVEADLAHPMNLAAGGLHSNGWKCERKPCHGWDHKPWFPAKCYLNQSMKCGYCNPNLIPCNPILSASTPMLIPFEPH